jgi:hypothetical protein
MDPATAALVLKGIELGAQLAVAYGSAEKVSTLVGGFITQGLTLEQINDELAAHVEQSRSAADTSLKAAGA